MATCDVNGVELYYEMRGGGERLVLTHGSWTDASSWGPALDLLAERYEVVVWDRRGHSRSQPGAGPGSRVEDSADLAGLIEHVGNEPVHVAGNSYGAIVTLTLVTERPELVASAAVHEPPLFGLLEGTRDPTAARELASAAARVEAVGSRIASGNHCTAARDFVENIALGPGSWDQLPAALREVMVANAPTFLDELNDPTALTIDAAALAQTAVPILLTHGTESPPLFPAVIAEINQLVPNAEVEALEGAGHMAHATHPHDWVALLSSFHADRVRS